MKKIVDNPDKSGRVVRKIAVQVAVFMLFFALISCEKADYPFEYEELEITEVFTSRFRISNHTGQFLMFDQLTLGLVIEPVNLPKEFQRDVRVQATVERIGEKTNERGHPLVKVTQIQETDLRDGVFAVGTNCRGKFVLDQMSVDADGQIHILASGFLPTIVPINLPEEFQWEYPCNIFRFARVTYRHTGERNPEGLSIVEIEEIHEFLRRTSAYVRKTDRWGYIFSDYSRGKTLIPTDLSEEFQVEGLHVQLLFIVREITEKGYFIVEVAEIYEVGTTPAQTRIIGGDNARIENHPRQVLVTQRACSES